jgi:hypothetical protein
MALAAGTGLVIAAGSGAWGIDKPARKVYVHPTPNAAGSNPEAGGGQAPTGWTSVRSVGVLLFFASRDGR